MLRATRGLWGSRLYMVERREISPRRAFHELDFENIIHTMFIFKSLPAIPFLQLFMKQSRMKTDTLPMTVWLPQAFAAEFASP